MDVITEKKCTICKKIKPITEFYKDAQHRDGYYTKCKSCHNKMVRNWQANNKEKFREMRRKRKKTHPEENRACSKKWAAYNHDRKIENGRRWRGRNPEYGQSWRKNNPDKIRNYAQIRRARLAEVGGDLTVDEWEAIQEFYGHKCLCCGRDDVKLTIDHVLPISLGGSHTADNIQPLCGPCNSSKRDKHIDYRKEYDHETSRD